MKAVLRDIVAYRIRTSYETLNEIEVHLQNGFLATAMNRLYYSGFYMISALALVDRFPTTKHKQLIGWFNKEYLKTGIIDPEKGKILRKAYERRQSSDYHDFVTLTKSQIEEYYSKMIVFVNVVEKVIQQKLKTESA